MSINIISIEELDKQIAQRMRKVSNDDNSLFVWKCCVCGKSSAKKCDIKRHVESKHVRFPGFDCNQ